LHRGVVDRGHADVSRSVSSPINGPAMAFHDIHLRRGRATAFGFDQNRGRPRESLQRAGAAPCYAKEAEVAMKTCLVVDDSSVIRKVARRILEGMQFEISEAEDGEQALDMCRGSLPDVVFLDLNMPRMDGMTFLKEMRSLPGGLRPKVVFCTTEHDARYINRALDAGADEYIMKPFGKEIIEAKFHQAGLI
jgi:two-component system, chemotaxis family, chemotaxis protein CheY